MSFIAIFLSACLSEANTFMCVLQSRGHDFEKQGRKAGNNKLRSNKFLNEGKFKSD